VILTKRSQQVDLRDLINSKLSEYDILVMYVGGPFKLNTSIKSPLPGHKHQDRSPSFSVGTSASGRLVWRDYSADMKGGAIDLVQVMYGLTYPQALQKVAKDFMLTEGTDSTQKIISAYKQPVIEPNRHTLIQVTTKKMTTDDLKWWGKYLITADDLAKEAIYSVKEYYINRHKQVLSQHERCYAYYYEGKGFKIYHPDRSRDQGKWKSSIPCSHVENIENLNGDKKVLVTKSKKDRITLSKILPYICINVQNEGTSGYTDEMRDMLKGREVIIMYDNDEAGVKNCKKICDMWNYRYVNVPKYLLHEGVKDASDWVKYTGKYDDLIEHLKIKQVI
jgi:5S rRNA maturation endonuclease (ribonuclease M5)